MAEYINMQQEEYDALQRKLATLHEEIISADEAIRKRILALADMDGGFYISEVSRKIQTLMQSLEEGAITILKNSFNDSESTVSVFVNTIIGIDVIEG
ncbi:MAG: hypothetical protein IKY23_07375 [Lachnospiraceae bacterium]|nr:hypothetical protein [Lachnospiraceae bacterium]